MYYKKLSENLTKYTIEWLKSKLACNHYKIEYYSMFCYISHCWFINVRCFLSTDLSCKLQDTKLLHVDKLIFNRFTVICNSTAAVWCRTYLLTSA